MAGSGKNGFGLDRKKARLKIWLFTLKKKLG
jgi:hypothetical protein